MISQQSSKYSLFLVELIIAILFFTISSAVCVQLYAKAYILSASTKELNNAISKVESTAEVIKSNPENPDTTILSVFSDSIIHEQSLKLGYNKAWQTCHLADASYIMKIDWRKEDQMLFATIHISDLINGKDLDAETIYSLEIVKHIPNVLK